MAQQNVAAPQAPQEEGKSPWGFIKNLVGDPVQFVGGLGELGKVVLGDAVKAGTEVIPGGQGDHDYATDDILKNLIPETGKYIKKNYLSGLDNLGEHLYNDPLFALMDATGVAQGVGAAKVMGAKSALKNPSVADELAKLGTVEERIAAATRAGQTEGLDALKNQSEELASLLSPQAQRVRKTLPGAARNRANPEGRYVTDPITGKSSFEAPFSLGGERYRFMGRGGDPAKLTENFGKVPLPANPYKRWRLNTLDKLLTRPLTDVLPREGSLLARGMEALDPLSGETDQLANALIQGHGTLGRAIDTAQRYGIDRIDHAFVADLRLGKAVNKLFGDYGSSFYRHRDQAKLEVEQTFKQNPYVQHIARTQGKRAAEDFLESLPERFQVATGQSFERMSIADITDQFVTPTTQLSPEQVINLERHLGIGEIDAEMGTIKAGDWAQVDGGGVAQRLRSKGFQVNQRGTRLDVVTPEGEAMSLMALPDEGIAMARSFRNLLDDKPMQNLEGIAEQALRHADELEMEGIAVAEGARGMVQGMHVRSSTQVLRRNDQVTPEAIRQSAQDLLSYVGRERRAKQMYAEELSESVNAKRLSNVPGERQIDKLHADMRWFIHKQMVEPSIERGFIKDYQTVINRQLLPYKLEMWDEAVRAPGYKDAITALREELAAAERAGDPEAAFTARRAAVVERFGRNWKFDLADTEELITHTDMALDLAEEFRQTGRQLPVYFPHIDPNQIKNSDWLAKRGTWGMSNMAGKGAFKQNTGLLYLDNKRFVKDPVEAYARRASQVIRANETYDFIEHIGRAMARPVNRIDDVDENVEMVWAPRGGKRIFQMQTELMDDAWEAYNRFMDSSGGEGLSLEGVALTKAQAKAQDAFADVMRKSYGDPQHVELFKRALVESNIEHLDIADEGIRRILENPNSQVQLYAIPKAAGKRLNAFSQARFGPGARMFWDGPTNFWRSMVLTFIPRWMVNNFLGNIVFAKLQGAKFRDVVRHALDPEFRAFVKKATEGLNERNRATLVGGLFTETTETALGSAERTLFGQAMRQTKESTVGVGARKWAQRFRHFNSMIEEHFRASSYVTALERQVAERSLKGTAMSFKRSFDELQDLAKYGADPEIANRALDSVNYFFNDYSALGPRERNVIRRFIMPFYGFYKHIVRLSFTYPGVDPARAAIISRIGETAQEFDTELGMVPSWLRASVPVWNDEEGNPVFLNTRGANPFDLLEDPMASVVGTFNPMTRGFLNYVSGRRLDRDGQPQFDAPSIAEGGEIHQPFGSDDQYRYDEETGQWHETTVRPDLGTLLTENLPILDLARDAYDMSQGQLGTRYGTGETKMDPETGQPRTPKPFKYELMKLLGLSMTPFDLEENQSYIEDDLAKAFMEYMRAQGQAPPADYGQAVPPAPTVFR